MWHCLFRTGREACTRRTRLGALLRARGAVSRLLAESFGNSGRPSVGAYRKERKNVVRSWRKGALALR